MSLTCVVTSSCLLLFVRYFIPCFIVLLIIINYLVFSIFRIYTIRFFSVISMLKRYIFNFSISI